jgi:hypothetical protein
MAKQRGVIKIDGTIDDLTFYKTSDGYLVRGRGGVSAERIATDPAFARTRENGAEFSRAGKASKLLRTAFRTQLLNARGKRTASRLTQEMMRVIHADAVNGRGMRNVVDGEKTLLQDFDFNEGAQLGSTLFAPFTATVNRVSGEATVSIPALVPANEVVAPAGATHFRIHTAAAAVDFEGELFEADAASSATLPWDGTATAPLTLTCNLTANSPNPIFLVLGTEFFQEVNGTNYALKAGAFNALTIVGVDQV